MKSATSIFLCIGWRARGPVVHKKRDRRGPQPRGKPGRSREGKFQSAAPDLTIIRLKQRGGTACIPQMRDSFMAQVGDFLTEDVCFDTSAALLLGSRSAFGSRRPGDCGRALPVGPPPALALAASLLWRKAALQGAPICQDLRRGYSRIFGYCAPL